MSQLLPLELIDKCIGSRSASSLSAAHLSMGGGGHGWGDLSEAWSLAYVGASVSPLSVGMRSY